MSFSTLPQSSSSGTVASTIAAINGVTDSSNPTSSDPTSATGTVSSTTSNTNNNNTVASDAATKLAEAIDDFLGDLEKKFNNISDEILGKLDEMADRCDRLEQEMMLREASAVESTSNRTASAGVSGSLEADGRS